MSTVVLVLKTLFLLNIFINYFCSACVIFIRTCYGDYWCHRHQWPSSRIYPDVLLGFISRKPTSWTLLLTSECYCLLLKLKQFRFFAISTIIVFNSENSYWRVCSCLSKWFKLFIWITHFIVWKYEISYPYSESVS